MYRHTVEIFYSEKDGDCITVVLELPGCSAFGETEEKALQEIKTANELWIEAAKREGRKILKPLEKKLLRVVLEKRWFRWPKLKK